MLNTIGNSVKRSTRRFCGSIGQGAGSASNQLLLPLRNDPIFVSCVLPAIIREVFDYILSVNAPPEQAWAKDWLGWADTLMPGKAVPWNDSRQQKQVWIDDLLDSFCQRHGVLELLVGKLKQEAAP